jgi:excisionase family DNA binding protein
VQAASYIGVSATKFDELVKDGRMPLPKVIDGRRVWCRDEVAEAFYALPKVLEDQRSSDPWVTDLVA